MKHILQKKLKYISKQIIELELKKDALKEQAKKEHSIILLFIAFIFTVSTLLVLIFYMIFYHHIDFLDLELLL
ncbi:hypothetical protein C9J20_14550 [Photobacterium phosphoreum]|nr:hypothetical protein CTM79_11540 [Photobacterium phosphoreum]PSW10149.1 hypothetical protein C9J20_14550 [Photobacterium phosphoreum]